ncbi:SGNH/GDSL hydrolase family protein [Mycoplasma sp. Sp33II]|uniref:SGNH/GDSL hydrolase family protein n=1 Tax=unclassified Mycoplasma TaxID=2683645 RepID=UPI003AAF2B7A
MKKKDLISKLLQMVGKVLSDKIEKDKEQLSSEIYSKYLNSLEEDISNLHKQDSPNIISLDKPIYYVALGDSISAGFDGFIDKDYPGKFINGAVVNGCSLGSYFAEILNKTNTLSHYANYAVSGTSITDWLNYLQDDETKIDQNNIVKDVLTKQGYKHETVMFDIKCANLITITIGAMDFFYLVFWYLFNNKTQELFDSLDAQNEYEALSNYLKNGYDSIMQIATKSLQEFVNRIKELAAPDANINIIAYPVPFLMLQNALQEHVFKLGQLPHSETNILESLIGLLNNDLKTISYQSGINYISLYNNEYWHKNASLMSGIYYDIHPSFLAYKKMALDLYIKLSTKQVTNSNLNAYDFNKAYWFCDYNFYKYQLEQYPDLNKIFGPNSQDYLNKLNDFDSQMILQRNYKNYPLRLSQFTGWILASSTKISYNIFNSDLYQQLDPERLLINYIQDFTTLENLVNEIMQTGIKSDLLSDVLNSLQEELDQIIKSKNITSEEILKIIFNIFKKKNLVLKSLYTLLNSNLVQYDKERFIQIIKVIVYNLASYIASKFINVIANLAISTSTEFDLDFEDEIKQLKKTLKEEPQISIFTNDIPTIIWIALENLIRHSDELTSYEKLLYILTYSSSNKQYIRLYTDLSWYILKWIRLWFAQKPLKTITFTLLDKWVFDSTNGHIINSEFNQLFENILSLIQSDENLIKALSFINCAIKTIAKEIMKSKDYKHFKRNIKKKLLLKHKIRKYLIFIFNKLNWKNKCSLIKILWYLR